MEHDKICDCPFKDRCETYADPLIDASRKGIAGLGCTGQDNFYRSRHCKTFSCKYLCVLLADMLSPKPAAAPHDRTAL